MGETNLLNVFLISLKEKTDLQKPFKDSIKNLNLIQGVDARSNGFVYKNYGLKINPPNKIAKIEFSKNKGVVGCYLSHYIIWKKIVSSNLNYSLILEDDAKIDDVMGVIEDNQDLKKALSTNRPTLVQLNKRTTEEKLPYWFDGTESYAVNLEGAKLLLKKTYDFSNLQGKFIEYAWDWNELKRGSYGLFKKYQNYDLTYDYSEKNTIRFPVDKFIGYCSLSYNCISEKLNIIVNNKIGLIDNNESTIICGKQVWTMSETEIEEFEKDDSYMWWDK
mgnify:CR=1 FL=1